MKKRSKYLIVAALSFVFLIFAFQAVFGWNPLSKLTGSNGNQKELQENPLVDYDTEIEDCNYIENYIKDNISSDILITISKISVYSTDDKNVDVRVRVIHTGGVYIPKAAQAICPIALEAISEKEYKLEEISIQEYEENNKDGVDTSTLIDWHTKDGVTGFLTDARKKEAMLGNRTIDELFDYFNVQNDEISKSISQNIEFGDMLDKFQGEWKHSELNTHIIINGNEVSSIHYGILDNKSNVNEINTFYFNFDDNGNLVVTNSYSQPRYILTIDENKKLEVKHVAGDDVDIYEKISDNTELPEIPKDPEIGMSETDVIQSTWGYTSKKNTTTTAYGEKEQWVYDKGYIYFEDGIVTAIQEK